MDEHTKYDLYDEVVVWDAYPQLMVSLILLTCFMTPLAWYILIRETSLYQRLPDRIQQVSIVLTRLAVCYTYLFLLGAILHSGYHTYYLRTYGEFPSSNMNLECSHLMNTDDSESCCSIYSHCSEGPFDSIDHDVYLFKWSPLKQCPTLKNMIEMNMKPEKCDNTEFGCCHISTTCDDYSRLNVDYHIYQGTIHAGFPKGYVKTNIPKTNVNGTECPTEKNVIDSFLSSSYETHVQTRGWFVFLFFCIILSPLILFRKDIYSLMEEHFNHMRRYVDIELSDTDNSVNQPSDKPRDKPSNQPSNQPGNVRVETETDELIEYDIP